MSTPSDVGLRGLQRYACPAEAFSRDTAKLCTRSLVIHRANGRPRIIATGESAPAACRAPRETSTRPGDGRRRESSDASDPALFGVFEMIAAGPIAIRPWAPGISGYASPAASGMFIVTVSFLFSTPGALSPT